MDAYLERGEREWIDTQGGETHFLKVKSWEVEKKPNVTTHMTVWCRCDWMSQGKRQQVMKELAEHLLG